MDDVLDSCGSVLILMLLLALYFGGISIAEKISVRSNGPSGLHSGLHFFEIILYFRLLFQHHCNEFIVEVNCSNVSCDHLLVNNKSTCNSLDGDG
eukprot:3784133-Ditylum_brightwellii.AAC.1